MSHIYSDTFFDYIDTGARSSARAFIGLLVPWLTPQSVLDLGCGRGVWLDEWRSSGVADVMGVDGDYVDRSALAIPPEQFHPANLTQPVETGRRFDLAQSLEVGEHLPLSAADILVESLTKAADRVVFSAAVKGQGGECHINEQPLSFWQSLFEARGYVPYDCLRPCLSSATEVEPWYRYNAILYVNEAGRPGLPSGVLDHVVPSGQPLRDGGDLRWRLRKTLVSRLPERTVTRIAQIRAARLAARARKDGALAT